MLGRPGCGVLQMNGQPTAQNTRETGANGDLPASATGRTTSTSPTSRACGTVHPLQIPHWGPPTHAMEIFRHAEEGSIRFLWLTGTNPAVSLPELHRIRSILDIVLDYAQRMGFQDKDGAPLVKWHDSESAFEAWKECSKGRPCDYSGITYERLRETAGIQWGR